ncbi:MAG: nucleotidyltransferase domain-containing protein [Candidatus Portnoybacteria bacterium]|nr:nucleotidyltransferase domain-containing protein [Candidatus Portnoybacteria bacterium]
MKEYLSFAPDKKLEIIEQIKKTLLKDEGVVFAFIFGSFLDTPSFRDIDIGIYVKDKKKEKFFDKEVELDKKIADACNLPFDIFEIKILNFAPNIFLNNIFSRGELLFGRDDKLLSGLIESSSLEAVANEYVAYQSLKELIPV